MLYRILLVALVMISPQFGGAGSDCSLSYDCDGCIETGCVWQPVGSSTGTVQCFDECMIEDASCYTDSCPPDFFTGYLRESDTSFCMDECSRYYIESEYGSFLSNVTAEGTGIDLSIYLNRFVDITTGVEYSCIECSAMIVSSISISSSCEEPVPCFADPCEVAGECQLNTPVECVSNFCGGCYADFYGIDGELVECYPSTSQCNDLTGVFFGWCDMFLGVGYVSGGCEYISGCGWDVDGLDYSDSFFSSMDECELACLGGPYTCEDIEYSYDQLHSGSYATCEFDNDCLAVWGDCSVGLGGCHYSVNIDSYPEQDINELVDIWTENNCMGGVCDCTSLPYAECVDGACESAYCMSDNPAGCFQTGCDDGYECIVTDDCVPSFCSCSGFYGTWSCTEDCGGGSCVPTQEQGDLNSDGVVNVLDVIILVNHILSPAAVELDGADINGDGDINILDVVALVGIILS